MILVHLISEVSGSDRTAAFKDTELLLVENLRVSEALVRCGLAQLSGADHLLRHHEIVSLRMADALLALDAPDAELVLHAHSNLADGTDSADHRVLPMTEMLQIARPILVLRADFRRVALGPHHPAADAHDGVLVVEILI